MALINSLCAMLNTSPFHRENYSRLMLGVVIQFYQRCSDRYQNLITILNSESGREARVALAAQWAQQSELQPCFNELLRTEVSLDCTNILFTSHDILGTRRGEIITTL